MNGYYGKYASIDLNTQLVKHKSLDESVYRKYIGGSGLGAYLLSCYCDPSCAPLSPDNPLIFTVGPFSGTLVPTSGRHQVVAKSPLTGTFGEADVGGNWGFRFRHSGFDGIVLTGSSPSPIYILIENDKISIHHAEDLWGKDTFTTTEFLKALYGEKSEISCIGTSGEQLQLIASILHDGREARMAGRGGLGAVMGSKLVKAVVVSGKTSRKVTFHDEAALKESAREVSRSVAGKMKNFGKFGTVGTIEGAEVIGDVPVKNWQEGDWKEGCEKLSGIRWKNEGFVVRQYFCKQCPIGCGRVVLLKDGEPGGGPEYETTCMYGANCLIDDYQKIFEANEIANRAGFDTISSGSTISMLMEAYEKGFVTRDDLGGIEPKWGSGESLIQLLTEIAENTPVGNLLSNGAARVAEKFNCEELAIHSKKLEAPAHDPRAYSSLALSYATGNRGACHLQGMTYSFEKGLGFPEYDFPYGEITRFESGRKPELTVISQHWMSLCDSLKICKFSLFGGVTVSKTAEWLQLATGWDISWEDLMLVGERIFNLKRLFNTKAGFSRSEDTLSSRLLNSPKGGGTNNHLPPNLQSDLDAYYALRHWDTEGTPTSQIITELELEEFSS